jgi:hypothetical protein
MTTTCAGMLLIGICTVQAAITDDRSLLDKLSQADREVAALPGRVDLAADFQPIQLAVRNHVIAPLLKSGRNSA